MPIIERSRRRVEDALDRLRKASGDEEIDVVEKTWHHPPAAYESVRRRFEAGTLGGAGVWTTDEEGRVLLVRHESRNTDAVLTKRGTIADSDVPTVWD